MILGEGMEIFDIHHHLGSLNGGSLQEENGWQDRDYANRVRIMDSNGVTQSAILAATWLYSGGRYQGHDALKRHSCRLSPARS
jgi:hypothetical protein